MLFEASGDVVTSQSAIISLIDVCLAPGFYKDCDWSFLTLSVGDNPVALAGRFWLALPRNVVFD